jgi:transmembrane sensor
MSPHEDQVRAAIAEQAGEWFVAHDDGPLNAEQSAALVAWLKASPVHVEEFLGVSVVARDLREACADPQYSPDALVAAARADNEIPLRSVSQPPTALAPRSAPVRRWLAATVALAAAIGVLSFGLFLMWDFRPVRPLPAAGGTTALHFEARHGEQLSHRLADNSVVHLDTDTAVTVQYSKTERTVTLTSGQADFEVAHEAARPFRVYAGPAEIIAVGTQFDVRLERGSTVVTVSEGRVMVGPSPEPSAPATSLNESRSERMVPLLAGQQLRLTAAEWPPTLVAVDARRSTAWLHRQIVFDHEPLERVAAEFNRYAPEPFEIVTPALRTLQISGVFATDDTQAFIAFLRSLKGVQVEVTATHILVSQK